jgi:hypothetical protein
MGLSSRGVGEINIPFRSSEASGTEWGVAAAASELVFQRSGRIASGALVGKWHHQYVRIGVFNTCIRIAVLIDSVSFPEDPMSKPISEQAKEPFVDKRTDGPGVSRIDPSDPAAPLYYLLAKMRSPVSLRDLMIIPVRTGYIGQNAGIDPAELPKSAAELYPEIRVSELAVPSPAGAIRCQVFTPPAAAQPRPMMLYFHGGGFTVGQSEDTAYITSRIAAENEMVVVSANYRVAPEWPFPACLDDSLAVLRWMQEHSRSIGGDGTRICVGGDSAGGNMAAALPLKARDEGAPPLQATLQLCPITDFFFEQYGSYERLAPVGIVYDTAGYSSLGAGNRPGRRSFRRRHQ